MNPFLKTAVRVGAIAGGLMTLAPLAASAGEWRLDPKACPDLREDRWDRAHDHGRDDRAEDRRDSRVVRCPTRAWVYVPDRREYARHYARPVRPHEVIIYRDGGHFYRDRSGAMISVRIGL